MIRRGDDIGEEILRLTNGIDEDEEKLARARAVLTAQDLENGKTLLSFTAAKGHGGAVDCLVKGMKEAVSRKICLLPFSSSRLVTCSEYTYTLVHE